MELQCPKFQSDWDTSLSTCLIILFCYLFILVSFRNLTWSIKSNQFWFKPREPLWIFKCEHHETFCFSLFRELSWSANQMSVYLIVSIELVPQCWKVKVSVPTVEKRSAKPRKSPSLRRTPPPLSPLLLHMVLPHLGPLKAEQTPPLAGKISTALAYYRRNEHTTFFSFLFQLFLFGCGCWSQWQGWQFHCHSFFSWTRHLCSSWVIQECHSECHWHGNNSATYAPSRNTQRNPG